MVMVTRSAHRKAGESFNKSDLSNKNIIPPWCSAGDVISSGQVHERRKPRRDVSKWEIRSTYPLRENIWEYLYENNTVKFASDKRRKTHKLTVSNKIGNGKTSRIVILLFVFIVITVSLWMSNKMPSADLITKVIPRAKFMTLLNIEQSATVTEECSHRMTHLAAELSKTKLALRNTLRQRRSMLYPSKIISDVTTVIDSRFIDGATALRGSDTEQWSGRVALWGIVPLWRAAPPPDTVLSLRIPTPADCWPFNGSHGEIIIHLPQVQQVNCISVEHVRPDTANSAPKHFVLYGILHNDTWVKLVDNQYRNSGPAKQYFQVDKIVQLTTVIFRVLTNQGNQKYTCVYRVHLYGNNVIDIYNK